MHFVFVQIVGVRGFCYIDSRRRYGIVIRDCLHRSLLCGMDYFPNTSGVNVDDDRIVSYYAIIMQVKRFQFVILYHYQLSVFEKELNNR